MIKLDKKKIIKSATEDEDAAKRRAKEAVKPTEPEGNEPSIKDEPDAS